MASEGNAPSYTGVTDLMRSKARRLARCGSLSESPLISKVPEIVQHPRTVLVGSSPSLLRYAQVGLRDRDVRTIVGGDGVGKICVLRARASDRFRCPILRVAPGVTDVMDQGRSL